MLARRDRGSGGIGRRIGLKIRRPHGHPGSSPGSPTTGNESEKASSGPCRDDSAQEPADMVSARVSASRSS
jgi:hypothetical protein